MNKVYLPMSNTPLTPFELAREANKLTKRSHLSSFEYMGKESRISGNHCDCMGNGEFELLPVTDPDVIDGGKRYMRCRICGCYSHL